MGITNWSDRAGDGSHNSLKGARGRRDLTGYEVSTFNQDIQPALTRNGNSRRQLLPRSNEPAVEVSGNRRRVGVHNAYTIL